MPSARLALPLCLFLLACAGCTAPPADAPTDGADLAEPAPDLGPAPTCASPRYRSPILSYTGVTAGEVRWIGEAEGLPGERVVAVFHRKARTSGTQALVLQRRRSTDADWLDVPMPDSGDCAAGTGQNGVSNRACSGAKDVRLAYRVPPEGGRFRVGVKLMGGGPWPGRARMEIVPATCEGYDTCFPASGSNCDGAPLSNCDELDTGLLRCPTSVGSQAHDSCCSRYGAVGYVCGACGSAANPFDQTGCTLRVEPPPGLPPDLIHSGGYIPCRAEWDIAFWNIASVPQQSALRDYDPLDVTYRVTELARLTVVGGVPTATPLPGARLYRAGEGLRRIDAEQGWCESGRFGMTANPKDRTTCQ